MKNKLFLLPAALCFFTFSALAHGDEDHKKKKEETTDSVQAERPVILDENSLQEKPEEQSHESASHRSHDEVKANFSDFPSLHPLVVHFPIVLLLLAALVQVSGLFKNRKPLSWITLLLTVGGFIGALAAAEWVHPHTEGLSALADEVLEEHEEYAEFTLWLSGIAVLLKLSSHFFLKRKIWAEAIVAVALIAAGWYVSLSGHYGAQLTHIEGVGPQGNFLETEEDEHSH